VIKNVVAKRDIPFLVLDGDMSDERSYPVDKTRSLLESFIEVMAARK
jgi:hypothetical protein